MHLLYYKEVRQCVPVGVKARGCRRECSHLFILLCCPDDHSLVFLMAVIRVWQ